MVQWSLGEVCGNIKALDNSVLARSRRSSRRNHVFWELGLFAPGQIGKNRAFLVKALWEVKITRCGKLGYENAVSPKKLLSCDENWNVLRNKVSQGAEDEWSGAICTIIKLPTPPSHIVKYLIIILHILHMSSLLYCNITISLVVLSLTESPLAPDF